MIPPASHPTWAKLIKGDVKHKFSQPSASMLFFNLQSEYRKQPSQLNALIGQAQAFFAKYEAVLAKDTRELFG